MKKGYLFAFSRNKKELYLTDLNLIENALDHSVVNPPFDGYRPVYCSIERISGPELNKEILVTFDKHISPDKLKEVLDKDLTVEIHELVSYPVNTPLQKILQYLREI